ncbi:lipase [Clavulina sp. PMI_390]|nr:lipase [Clavulina sp. PMI_390]
MHNGNCSFPQLLLACLLTRPLMMIVAGVAFFLAAFVEANPLPRASTVSAMMAAEELAYNTTALFASAAYCPADQTATWSCGESCSVLSGFIPYGSGGDGDETQYWYVGYDPTYLKAIVVAHQGTNPDEIGAILDDLDFFLEPLDQTYFPGISSSIEVHSGFQASHNRAASGILTAVQAAMSATGSTHVVLTGHSLGAALAVLTAVYLPLHLPSGTTYTTNVFGLPRPGNPAFANYVDANITNFSYVTNKLDYIPILPGEFLGYKHPSGEKHIVTSGDAAGDWYACQGQDNESVDCTTGAVPYIWDGEESDHQGPYGTVYMGTCDSPYSSSK